MTLDRKTLALLKSFGAGNADLGTEVISAFLQEALQNPETLVVLYPMGPPGANPNEAPIANNLASFGANSNAVYNAANGQFASVYAFIGNPGLSTNDAFELSSFLNPQTTGQIDAVLTRDINGNYFPVYPRFVTV